MTKMKTTLFTFLFCLISGLTILAQTPPQAFKYQAIVRNLNGDALPNRAVRFQVGIQRGISGPVVYQEQHADTTNAQGLVVLEIGRGTLINSSPAFTTLRWDTSAFYLNLNFDSTGNGNFVSMGSFELLSVPYSLYAQRSGNGVNPGTQLGQMMYWNGTSWVNINPGTGSQILTMCYGIPTWTTGGYCYRPGMVHCTSVTPVVPVINPTTNKVWMDRNLGASRVATTNNDASAYGDSYQWGRLGDGHQCRNSATTTSLSSSDTPGSSSFILVFTSPNDWRSPQNNNLWQGVNGVNNPCPMGFRLPTETELDAERLSWSASNITGAFASPLKFTLAGWRSGSGGGLNDVGTYGDYWTSTVSGSSARFMYIDGSSAGFLAFPRVNGYSVRCIQD